MRRVQRALGIVIGGRGAARRDQGRGPARGVAAVQLVGDVHARGKGERRGAELGARHRPGGGALAAGHQHDLAAAAGGLDQAGVDAGVIVARRRPAGRRRDRDRGLRCAGDRPRGGGRQRAADPDIVAAAVGIATARADPKNAGGVDRHLDVPGPDDLDVLGQVRLRVVGGEHRLRLGHDVEQILAHQGGRTRQAGLVGDHRAGRERGDGGLHRGQPRVV